MSKKKKKDSCWEPSEEEKQREEQLKQEFEEWFDENEADIEAEAETIAYGLSEEAIEALESSFLHKQQEVKTINPWKYERNYNDPYDYAPLSKANIHVFLKEFDGMPEYGIEAYDESDIAHILDGEELLELVVYNRYIQKHPEAKTYTDDIWDASDKIYEICSEAALNSSVVDDVNERFTSQEVEHLLRQNPYYKDVFNAIDERRENLARIREAISDKIPENPVELFPLARQMKRKVFLHIGPTNSGKTYDAMERLMAAENGIYLAPLRLMAYEAYETMGANGIPCAMETGEERKIPEHAQHFAKTIELFDPMESYEVAVVDECQMLADKDRGGAWTAAIMGLRAPEIHLCLSPDAEKKVTALCNACGDETETIRHERKTPLVVENTEFKFPKSVQKGDALIVFSKRSVIACAAELQGQGLKCSIIYGALPYDVRQNEVDRFLSGETNVVVSTDAIGMGMNLPVRRIVFLETKKYDGETMRQLKPTEIKQIAGRAGRFGLYDAGYVTSEFDRKPIRHGVECKDSAIKEAALSFPESIVEIPGKLSETIEQWAGMPTPDGYKKADIEDFLKLAKKMEKMTDNKRLVYSYAMIPFDIEDEELLDIWENLAAQVAAGDAPNIGRHLMHIDRYKDDMQALESIHKRYDLLYNFARRAGDEGNMELLIHERERISEYIMALLKKQSLPARKCSRCGRTLAWNFPYKMCGPCHGRMYPRRGYYGSWAPDDDEGDWMH